LGATPLRGRGKQDQPPGKTPKIKIPGGLAMPRKGRLSSGAKKGRQPHFKDKRKEGTLPFLLDQGVWLGEATQLHNALNEVEINYNFLKGREGREPKRKEIPILGFTRNCQARQKTECSHELRKLLLRKGERLRSSSSLKGRGAPSEVGGG